MKLSEIKKQLESVETVSFKLENGTFVPEHFHVTEVGIVTRHFIDCGGTVRHEKAANFQLWDANDFEHRLKPGKLQKIIALSEQTLGMEDLEVEVEYQSDTIGRYDLGFDGLNFVLHAKKTACLAQDQCAPKINKPLQELQKSSQTSCCTPNGGCC